MGIPQRQQKPITRRIDERKKGSSPGFGGTAESSSKNVRITFSFIVGYSKLRQDFSRHQFSSPVSSYRLFTVGAALSNIPSCVPYHPYNTLDYQRHHKGPKEEHNYHMIEVLQGKAVIEPYQVSQRVQENSNQHFFLLCSKASGLISLPGTN